MALAIPSLRFGNERSAVEYSYLLLILRSIRNNEVKIYNL